MNSERSAVTELPTVAHDAPGEEAVYTVVSTNPPRVDGIEKVTGTALYAADYSRPDLLYGKIKRSPHPHARILRIDASRALDLEGVRAVLSHENVPRVQHAGAPPPRAGGLVADQYIFDNKVRFVGDGFAAVAAESEEIAEEALELIEVDYEILPAAMDVDSAMALGAALIHDTEKNLAGPPFVIERGNLEDGFQKAEFIIDELYETGRPSPCYMEPNACLCHFDNRGKLTVWSATQCAFMVRGILSEVLDIPSQDIRVIVEHMGGGFGAKQDLYQHEFVCALLAKNTGRPVKMEYTRKECFLGGRSRHPTRVRLKQGFQEDGTLTAREVHYTSNTGAYASHGLGITAVGCMDIASLYRCQENQKIEGISVYTNCPISGAYRGFGAVQAFFALDCQIDEIAHILGIDPLELRLRTCVGNGDLSPSAHPLRGNGLAACLKRGAKEVGWFEREKSAGHVSSWIRRGWGIGTEMHSSGAYPDIKEQSNAVAKMNENGSIHLLVGMADLGTGTLTMVAQIAAEELGVSLEEIRVISGDTDVVPFDSGAYASRTTYVGGGAVLKAVRDLKAQIFELAATRLETSVEELQIRRSRVVSRNNPRKTVTLKDLVKGEGSIPPRTLIGHGTNEPKVAYSYAAHFAEIAVDTETGQIEVLQLVAVHEIGKAINPMAVEGQIEGGVQQGIGHALTEDFIIDQETGQPLNAGFVDYKMPLALDMPKVKVIILEEEPDPGGPFGAKGIGEDPIIPPAAAIANALYDALGVRIREFPITPEKVLTALKSQRGSDLT